jgi:hypothetical protein
METERECHDPNFQKIDTGILTVTVSNNKIYTNGEKESEAVRVRTKKKPKKTMPRSKSKIEAGETAPSCPIAFVNF